jgi:hypothetical protein
MVGTKESGLEEMMHWWENVHLCIGSAKTSERALGAGAAWSSWSRRDLHQAAQVDSPLAGRVMHR